MTKPSELTARDRGVATSEPSIYFVGLPFQCSFASDVLPGVGRDAEYVVR